MCNRMIIQWNKCQCLFVMFLLLWLHNEKLPTGGDVCVCVCVPEVRLSFGGTVIWWVLMVDAKWLSKKARRSLLWSKEKELQPNFILFPFFCRANSYVIVLFCHLLCVSLFVVLTVLIVPHVQTWTIHVFNSFLPHDGHPTINRSRGWRFNSQCVTSRQRRHPQRGYSAFIWLREITRATKGHQPCLLGVNCPFFKTIIAVMCRIIWESPWLRYLLQVHSLLSKDGAFNQTFDQFRRLGQV